MNSGMEAAFWALATVLTVAGLWREWHPQYVVTIVAVMFFISAGAIWVAHGLRFLDPLLATILVVNSRGVMRLALRSMQERPYYGWWVMGLASVIAAPFQWLKMQYLPMPVHLGISLFMQLATIPWLIKRKPGSSPSRWPAFALGMIVTGYFFGAFSFVFTRAP